jgi:coenzyme Q-binding protein COQ10
MGTTIIESERRLPYPARDLCLLVGDVKSYPRFIPWIKALRVIEETREGEGWRGVAQATVGWKTLLERFSTHVVCDPDAGEVHVRLSDGPFKRLENKWRFREGAEPGHAIVSFWIAYEFRNPVLQALVKINREHAAGRIMEAFEQEAARRFAKARE